MTSPGLRLHAKLYRAKAIDIAIELAYESHKDVMISRKKMGEYHVVDLSGLEGEQAGELLRELADAALMATVEIDAR